MHAKKWYEIFKFLKIFEGAMEDLCSFYKLKIRSNPLFTILLTIRSPASPMLRNLSLLPENLRPRKQGREILLRALELSNSNDPNAKKTKTELLPDRWGKNIFH